MTSKIERVARAIADQTGMGHRWTEHRQEARAAITAMREPSESLTEIRNRARQMVPSLWPQFGPPPSEAALQMAADIAAGFAWNELKRREAMIDELLEEK